LYDRVSQRGVRLVAEELYARAEHTVSLGARNNRVLNANTTEIAIVSLPQANRPQDVQVRKALVAALLKIDPGVVVEDLPAGHPEVITILRLEQGFPIGIAVDNYALLPGYGDGAAAGHAPHVVTLAPHDRAAALPEYLELDRALRGQPVPAERSDSTGE
jgi:hypothetical protein